MSESLQGRHTTSNTNTWVANSYYNCTTRKTYVFSADISIFCPFCLLHPSKEDRWGSCPFRHPCSTLNSLFSSTVREYNAMAWCSVRVLVAVRCRTRRRSRISDAGVDQRLQGEMRATVNLCLMLL